MIISKENPIGQDAVIAKIQKAIHDAFDVKWSVGQNTTGGIICYPRCYCNFRKELKVIEYFDSTTSVDYIDVVGRDLTSMFITSESAINVLNSNFLSKEIDIFFIVDLSLAYPSVAHRADEEVRSEVLKVLQTIPNTTIKEVVLGVENIFRHIKHSNTTDMHPMHCFKVCLIIDRYSKSENKC